MHYLSDHKVLEKMQVLLSQRPVKLLAVLFLFGFRSWSQTSSLSLASASTVANGSVSLELTLTASPSPAGIQWTFVYAPGDIVSFNIEPGPALRAADKTMSCSAANGSLTCLAVGMNSTTIANDIVAVVTATLAASTSSASVPIAVSTTIGVLPDGTATGVAGFDSALAVQDWQPPPITPSSLVCTPSAVITPDNSTCTLTLTGVAPPEGFTVVLSNDSAAVVIPSSVAVSPGTNSITFTATAGSVTFSQTVTLSASLNGASASTSLTLLVPGSMPGMTAAYALDEGKGSVAFDSSGYGNTGRIQGPATWVGGRFGNAFLFDGATNYIDLGRPPSLLGTGSMTWSAWVFITGNPPDDGQIVALSTDNLGWQFKTSPDTGPRTFAVAVGLDGLSLTQRYSVTVPVLNTWYHVAGIYNADAQTLDIYVNGTLDNGVLRGAVPNVQAFPPVNVTIGKRDGGYYFNGVIDNLRIYNRALSAPEIQQDMVTPVNMTTADTPLATTAAGSMAAAAGIGSDHHTYKTSVSPLPVLSGASAGVPGTFGGETRTAVNHD
jgi:hypothetical protein